MEQRFYSHGKLLISGEYAVLDGALALAVPTRLGQHMTVRENDSGILNWTGLDEKGNSWFKAAYQIKDLKTKREKDSKTKTTEPSERLRAILNYARELNPDFLTTNSGYTIETQLEFNRHWGLGSSSTLISNIAQWAEVDAYSMNRHIFGGSGYDIACAQSDGPLYYMLSDGQPNSRSTEFNPPFKDRLFFVYLNQKMDSRKAIEQYRKAEFDKKGFLSAITEWSTALSDSMNLQLFMDYMNSHEQLLSGVLGIPPVKELLFANFPGSIKSLGAWGGDFVLAASDKAGPEYFVSLGYKTVLPFSEMVLTKKGDH